MPAAFWFSFADENCIDTIEKNISEISSVTDLFEKNTPEKIALKLLEGLEPNILDEANPIYKCGCSRQRTERLLASLGNEELDKLAQEMENIDVDCHFCGIKYRFSPEEIKELKKT